MAPEDDAVDERDAVVDERVPARIVLVALLGLAAGAHTSVIREHLEKAPYVGILFIAFIVACFGMAVAVVLRDDRRVYLGAAGLCGAAVVAYAATRTFRFPQIGDDVGNWFEVAGVVSVVSEIAVVAVALMLARSRRPTGARVG